MTDLIDVDPTRNFFGFFVGPNGSGKSIAIASWMKLGSVYYFDFDGRMASVANWYKQRGLKSGQIEFDSYGPTNVYDAFTKLASFVESCPHAAICIDSFTAVTVSAVNFSLKRRIGKMYTNAAPKSSKGDMIIPDWDEWNGEATYVTFLLDLCKQIAANGTAVFWTGHPVQRLKIEGSGGNVGSVKVQTKYAAFGMKSDSLVPIYFNEIYHFYTEWDYENQRPKRICQTQPEGDVAAKTAFNFVDTKFEWTNQDFRERFLEETKRGNDAVGLTV